MAQMAQPKGRANTDDVGAVCPCAERLSPPCGASRAQCVPLSSETIVRGAGCPSGASPDLWEPRVGNRPRPPGRCANPTYNQASMKCSWAGPNFLLDPLDVWICQSRDGLRLRYPIATLAKLGRVPLGSTSR